MYRPSSHNLLLLHWPQYYSHLNQRDECMDHGSEDYNKTNKKWVMSDVVEINGLG